MKVKNQKTIRRLSFRIFRREPYEKSGSGPCDRIDGDDVYGIVYDRGYAESFFRTADDASGGRIFSRRLQTADRGTGGRSAG